jgi:predicted glycosyltransferase
MTRSILIVVTHLLGAGHLTRAAALASALATAGHRVVLVSGGAPQKLISPGAATLVQLPPVRTSGTDFTRLLDENGLPVDETRMEARRQLLLETFSETQPDVVVTELFPFGRRVLAGEFLPLLELAAAARPRPLVVSSIRDILVAPKRPGRAEEAHERLLRFYDLVLVHGDDELVPLSASWPVDESIRRLLKPTGYIDDGTPPSNTWAPRRGIVVAGGSSAAAMPLLRVALEAARGIWEQPWHVLVGHGVSDPDFQALQDLAPAHTSVERARSDYRQRLAASALSISQAGYNTAVDLLRTRPRSILVPFEAGGETEQRLRAKCLEKAGRAIVIPEAELNTARLQAEIRRSLADPLPRIASVDLDGLARSVSLLESWCPARPSLSRPLSFEMLDRALERARDRGVGISFWWRDDDAVEETPALETLIRLATAHRIPLALAAIPARIRPSLPARISEAEDVSILVHGLRHTNHSPRGEKKAEFGSERALSDLLGDARAGLEKARYSSRAQVSSRAKVLPVFVPPWNRVARALVPELRRAGFSGISSFQDRAAAYPASGLLQINAHLDPVAWHHGQGLVDPAVLIRELAGCVERRTDGMADPQEPIGLLTHHLVHDGATWAFCEALLGHLEKQGVPFAHPASLFTSESSSSRDRDR